MISKYDVSLSKSSIHFLHARPTSRGFSGILNGSVLSDFPGKWYVRRFDPDTVQNGHIYSTMKEEKVFISSFSVG